VIAIKAFARRQQAKANYIQLVADVNMLLNFSWTKSA
jgi:hypothetical protein